MKKIFYGVSAIISAIAGVAFTGPSTEGVSRYYFKYSTNGIILSNAQPAYTSIDPYTCMGIGVINCDVVATSYNVSGGVYFPAGAQSIRFKPGEPLK